MAGDSSNDFTGTMVDGRKARLLQISRKRNGQVTAWSPDGNLIPATKVIKHGYANNGYLHFLVEYESTADPDKINGGLGSGPSTPGGPSTMTFGGGWAERAAEPGRRRVISLIDVPKEDGERESFTFGVSDTGWQALAAFNPKKPSDNGGIVSFSATAAKAPFPWEKWKEKRPEPKTALKFTDTTQDFGDRRVVAYLSNGTREIPEGNWSTESNTYGALKNLYFLKAPLSQVMRVEIQQRQSFAVEMLNVALKPKSAAGP